MLVTLAIIFLASSPTLSPIFFFIPLLIACLAINPPNPPVPNIKAIDGIASPINEPNLDSTAVGLLQSTSSTPGNLAPLVWASSIFLKYCFKNQSAVLVLPVASAIRAANP